MKDERERQAIPGHALFIPHPSSFILSRDGHALSVDP